MYKEHRKELQLLGAGQKVQGGGWAGGNENPVPQKNMTHPPVVAQNFGDPTPTLC